tara:strand:- start:1 stop:1710 length:1710 start_codon:yes stop_codon:yes gene_type:complete
MASSGNFATLLNGLLYQVGANTTYSLGNTKYQSSTAGTYSQQASTLAPSSGKWYAEMYVNTVGNLNFLCLVGDVGVSDTTNNYAYPNRTSNGGMGYAHSGLVRFNGSDTSSGYSTYTDGDIIQIAFDIDNTKVWFGKNNTWQNSGDPANGTNASYTTWTTTYSSLPTNWHVAGNIGNTGANTFNFGQDDTFGGVVTAEGNADGNGKGVFKYAPPTGFLAMCSSNLSVSDDIDPAQTDDDYPGKNFGVVTYTGNGSTQSITGLGFQPDLVWLKSRSNTKANALFDSNRGVTKYFSSDSTGAETTDTSTLTAFGSDGFSLASPAANNLVNGNGFTYVGWAWRANAGTTASNSDGASTTTVQANTKAGFSIIETPNYSSNSTFGHGLSSAPEFFTVKLTGGSQWATYHKGLTSAGYYVALNSSNAQASGSFFNSTAPTSSVFSLGASFGGSGAGICYAWHSVEGYSKFGTYVGNANADGPFIYTGFRPSMLFLKNATASNGWFTFDKLRDGFNDQNDTLSWQDTTVEDNTYKIDILSNGFKIRGSNNAHNQSGQTFIYGAWADVPFKYNNAR